MTTKIYLVRHGATDWNINKKAQGHADVLLAPEGKLQAIETANRLARVDLDAVYSSDLRRASDTAREIAEPHGLDVILDPDFREIDQGEWTGLTPDEIRQRWPDLWGPARYYSARPGGESPDQVRSRALEGLRRVVEKHRDGKVVLVSHGGTMRWIMAEGLQYEDDKGAARLRGVGNGAIVCIDARFDDGRLRIDKVQRWDGNTVDLDDPND